MAVMEQLCTILERLLQQDFHLAPVHTQRQDQWYKRRYEAWRKAHPERDLLILTPRESSDQWTPRLQDFATMFAGMIENATIDRRRQTVLSSATLTAPSDGKLFADSVLDESQTYALRWAVAQATPLTPAMQRRSFWASTSKVTPTDLRQRGGQVKALLVCGQIDALLYLAADHDTLLRETASIGVREKGDVGWEGIVDDVLEILIFVSILRCYSDQFAKGGGYVCWVPFVFHFAESAVGRYMDADSKRKAAQADEQLQQDMERCFQILSMVQLLSTACGWSPIKWQRRVATAFLHFLGFEAWNRDREGQSYLGCQLNVKKDDKWLRTMVSKTHHDANTSVQKPVLETASKSSPRRDPLHLRDAKTLPTPELDEDDLALQQQLVALESDEASYGLKRSTKYQRKNLN